MDIWNVVAERKIREAMDEGAFDHLDGTGQPLDLRENPYEDPSDRMANRLLKNNGFAPEWILDGKDIELEIEKLYREREFLEEAEYRARAERINSRIATYNLKVPSVSCQKPLLTLIPIG